jgi:hypothetical protein
VWPARTWREHGRPRCGRWRGWLNDDQPYLVGMRVDLSDYGGGRVLAEFADGDRVVFDAAAPFRLEPAVWQ